MITRRCFLGTSALTLAGASAIAFDRAPAFAQKRELTLAWGEDQVKLALQGKLETKGKA